MKNMLTKLGTDMKKKEECSSDKNNNQRFV